MAKGLDIQAEFALTDSFTIELATGYTDARYTQDSRLVPTADPVVSSGDAITGQSGQPGAPFTATIGLEYKFSLANHASFIRVDDEYEGRAKWPSPGQDPTTSQYDSANYVLSPTNFASARAGMNFGDLQIAAFVDNLATRGHELQLQSTTAAVPAPPGRQFTFRPRTMGYRSATGTRAALSTMASRHVRWRTGVTASTVCIYPLTFDVTA